MNPSSLFPGVGVKRSPDRADDVRSDARRHALRSKSSLNADAPAAVRSFFAGADVAGNGAALNEIAKWCVAKGETAVLALIGDDAALTGPIVIHDVKDPAVLRMLGRPGITLTLPLLHSLDVEDLSVLAALLGSGCAVDELKLDIRSSIGDSREGIAALKKLIAAIDALPGLGSLQVLVDGSEEGEASSAMRHAMASSPSLTALSPHARLLLLENPGTAGLRFKTLLDSATWHSDHSQYRRSDARTLRDLAMKAREFAVVHAVAVASDVLPWATADDYDALDERGVPYGTVLVLADSTASDAADWLRKPQCAVCKLQLQIEGSLSDESMKAVLSAIQQARVKSVTFTVQANTNFRLTAACVPGRAAGRAVQELGITCTNVHADTTVLAKICACLSPGIFVCEMLSDEAAATLLTVASEAGMAANLFALDVNFTFHQAGPESAAVRVVAAMLGAPNRIEHVLVHSRTPMPLSGDAWKELADASARSLATTQVEVTSSSPNGIAALFGDMEIAAPLMSYFVPFTLKLRNGPFLHAYFVGSVRSFFRSAVRAPDEIADRVVDQGWLEANDMRTLALVNRQTHQAGVELRRPGQVRGLRAAIRDRVLSPAMLRQLLMDAPDPHRPTIADPLDGELVADLRQALNDDEEGLAILDAALALRTLDQ